MVCLRIITPIRRMSMTLQIVLLISLMVLISGCCSARPSTTTDLTAQLGRAGAQIQGVIADAQQHRLQILISEVKTNAAGQTVLERHGFRLGAEYFYPASSVKLFGAVAALQTIEQLARENRTIDLLNVPMEISPLFPDDPAQVFDASNLAGGKITVGHEIRKIALVSDNQAFNRLFDLVGHEGLNRRMWALGLKSVVLNHRLSESRSIPAPLASAEIIFHASEHDIRIPARLSQLTLTNSATELLIGKGYVQGDTLVPEPMNFAPKNGVLLADLQDLLIKLVRPDIELSTPRLELTPEHREFLITALSEFPRESKNPVYDAIRFPDDCSKFLLPGIRRVFPATQPAERIQVTGKTGQAYGFSIENSYLRNPKNGRAVFVSAAIYANSNSILNDDQYDYATISEPFLADLGAWVARRWLKDGAN